MSSLLRLLKRRDKRKLFFATLVTLGLLFVVLEVAFLLLGGKYLAWQIMPPLPMTSTISTNCYTSGPVHCQLIQYKTPQSPQGIIDQWQYLQEIYEYERRGTTHYILRGCNESFPGLQYALFHKNQEGACIELQVYFDNTLNLSIVQMYVTWSVCPYIINEISPTFMRRVFKCSRVNR